jgi:hypothetical protein
MQDIKIGYSGGSGGFLLLHLLLLSGKFYTAFDSTDSLQNIINSQWDIKNHCDWKKSETLPNNLLTALSTDTQTSRLYFFCNPGFENSSFTQCHAKSLILYTDIHSQADLAFLKKSMWWQNGSNTREHNFVRRSYGILVEQWNMHYCNIKDPSWPSRVSPRRIHKLSTPIYKEILESEHTQNRLKQVSDYLDGIPFGAILYKNTLVDQYILPFLNNANVVIKLQDLVNSNGSVLLDILDIPCINKQQLDLINHWKKLHPPALLEKIGIKI